MSHTPSERDTVNISRVLFYKVIDFLTGDVRAHPDDLREELFEELYATAPQVPAEAYSKGSERRSTGFLAPKDRYVMPVLFNPYTGAPRDVRDVQSDPQGILIVPPGAAIAAVKESQP